MGLPINFDPSQPVQNSPFFYPQTNSLSTPQGANLVIGSGLDVSQGGTLSAIGTVDVTRVDTGVGLTGGPITSTGTISLADTTVSAGSYTYGSFTVDAQGRLTAAASGTAAVTAVTGTTPISVTSGSTPVVSVADSSTSGKGVVQLNDTTNNSSTDLALTAAQGKNLQDQIDALAITSNLTFAGTFDTTVGPKGVMTTVSAAAAGLAVPFVVGNPLPAPAAGNAEFFVIISTGGDYGPTTTPASTPPFHVGDWFLSSGTAWEFLNLGFQAPAATTTVEGVVYLATDLEVQTGTDTSNKAVNPASLQAKVSDSTSTTDSFAIASSTAVKSAYDLANAAIPGSTFNSKGDIIVGTGNDTYGNFPTGTNGQVLVVDSAETFGVKWVNNSPPGVSGVTGTAPITVDNTDPANPIIGASAASISAAGVVQLNNTVTSTSTTEAATANAVKTAYDAAIAAQTNGPLTSDTVLYVNCTDGNDLTAARGTDKPYATITAALAAASEGDTILLSPGTFTESFTISKAVNISGTFTDQATWSGTKIIGNVVVTLVGAGVQRNLAVSDIYFISVNSTSPVSITGMSPLAGGINTFTGCTFTQQLSTDTTQFAFQTSGTWTRSVYLRGCTIDGNFKHNAGTVAGASGYIVIDALQGIGNSSMYHYILTGTVEYRNPSNTLASIFQTGGLTIINNASAGITANGATTSAVFGGTGFSYKGTAAAAGAGTVYFQGGSNQGTGKVDIGANVIYGWTNLTIDPANLTVNVAAIAYTTAVPSAANAQSLTQQRPRLELLKTASTVTAANQLGTVIDLTTGTIYSVTSFDAGTY